MWMNAYARGSTSIGMGCAAKMKLGLHICIACGYVMLKCARRGLTTYLIIRTVHIAQD